MKSRDEKHSGWLLVIGITVGVLALTAGPALAALTFSGTSISGDGAVVIDSSSTISIGTSEEIMTALGTPSAPTVNQTGAGTPGTTTYSYQVIANNAVGYTVSSSVGTTTAGNATLDGTNWNNVVTAAVAGSTFCDVYRTAGGATQGYIGSVTCGGTLQDKGLVSGQFGGLPLNGRSTTGIGISNLAANTITLGGDPNLLSPFPDLSRFAFSQFTRN